MLYVQPLCQLLIDSSTNLRYLLPPWSSSKFDLPFSDISCRKLNFNAWSSLLQITAIQTQCILFPLQHTFTLCLASVNLVYSASYFKIIIVIKADIPDEMISFTFSAQEKYLLMSLSIYAMFNRYPSLVQVRR